MESVWPRLAELPLVLESCQYDRLHAILAHEFERVTTHALHDLLGLEPHPVRVVCDARQLRLLLLRHPP